MKHLKILFAVLIISALTVPQKANAQAFVIKDDIDILYSPFEEVPSSYFMTVETPNGNWLWKAVWYLDYENHYEDYQTLGVPTKGTMKIEIWHPFPGTDIVAHDMNAMLYPDGKLVCIIHINPAGLVTPNPGKKNR